MKRKLFKQIIAVFSLLLILLASQNNFAQKSVLKSTKKAAPRTGKKTNLKQRIVSAENWKTISDETGIFTFQMPGKIEKSRSTSHLKKAAEIKEEGRKEIERLVKDKENM